MLKEGISRGKFAMSNNLGNLSNIITKVRE